MILQVRKAMLQKYKQAFWKQYQFNSTTDSGRFVDSFFAFKEPFDFRSKIVETASRCTALSKTKGKEGAKRDLSLWWLEAFYLLNSILTGYAQCAKIIQFGLNNNKKSASGGHFLQLWFWKTLLF